MGYELFSSNMTWENRREIERGGGERGRERGREQERCPACSEPKQRSEREGKSGGPAGWDLITGDLRPNKAHRELGVLYPEALCEY